MSVIGAETEPALDADRQQEKKWRRRSLWALLLLLPATMAEMSHENIRTLLKGQDLIARDVVWDDEAHFGGSDWKLSDLRAALGMANLPPNAVPVLADFTVKVGDADLQNLWLNCKIALVDGAGRRWSPTFAVRLSAPDDVKNCNAAIFSGAKPGDTLKIRETFLVPKDATATIRPTIGLASERPYYLRFQRPER